MALPSLRLFAVTVVIVLVLLVSSSEEHEWIFDSGRTRFDPFFLSVSVVPPPKKMSDTFKGFYTHKVKHLWMIKHLTLFLLSTGAASVRLVASTFSSHSQISKAHSPTAINRLSCVASLSASQSCEIGERDSWAVSPWLVKTTNAQAAHESVSQNVRKRGNMSLVNVSQLGVTRGDCLQQLQPCDCSCRL